MVPFGSFDDPNGAKNVPQGLVFERLWTSPNASTSAHAPRYSGGEGFSREARAVPNARLTSISVKIASACSYCSIAGWIAGGTTRSGVTNLSFKSRTAALHVARGFTCRQKLTDLAAAGKRCLSA